jgi:hypothetical protein
LVAEPTLCIPLPRRGWGRANPLGMALLPKAAAKGPWFPPLPRRGRLLLPRRGGEASPAPGRTKTKGLALLPFGLWFSLLCSSSRKTSRAIPKGLALLLLQRVLGCFGLLRKFYFGF